MAVTAVVLEDEHGTPLLRIEDEQLVLRRLLPPFDDATSPMLRYVDPYGDTVFNRLQMEAVLQELDRLAAQADGTSESQFFERLRGAATRCAGEPHLYLRFVGD